MHTKSKAESTKAKSEDRHKRLNKRVEKSERELLLELLEKVFYEGEFIHLALRKLFSEYPDLGNREKAFLTRSSHGILERYLQLDYVISLYSSVKLKKLKPVVLLSLRIALYQFLFMDKIPDHAIVDEAVKSIKKRKLQGLVPFVNAVLRKIVGEKEEIKKKLASLPKEDSISLCLPQDILEVFLQDYGRDRTIAIAEAFLRSDGGFYIRNEEGEGEQVSGNILEEERFRSGAVTIQDFSSQAVGKSLSLKEGDLVLDSCSAPGGKACHIASLLKGSGKVYARDAQKDKLRYIVENQRRLGLENMEIEHWDARVRDERFLKDGEGLLDVVLCDAPCSGLGVIGRKPDIRLHFSKESLDELQNLQREILTTVQAYVKKGGQLLYSTCSLSFKENEENRDFILRNFPFTLIKEEKFMPGEPSDGFYLALFQRKSEE
jgi:possible rRNA (cytosine-5-)-methyltransferase